MSKKELNIDKSTRQLIQKSGKEEPSADFTKNVMAQIIKDPEVQFNFSFTKDEKESKIWLLLSVGAIFVGYIFFFLFRNDFNLAKSFEHSLSAKYLKILVDFIEQIYYELSLSPYVLIGLAGVIVLILIDKSVVKFLHSL
ncbi:MAG TPA: hypothetical protein VJ896_06655 [Bacteroidales bacterium]|nr:hypothetical protein [Bacteroidales bacterium]